jgi:hypothetical protein
MKLYIDREEVSLVSMFSIHGSKFYKEIGLCDSKLFQFGGPYDGQNL